MFELHLYQTLSLGISRIVYAFEMLHKFKYVGFKTPSEFMLIIPGLHTWTVTK